MELEGKMIVNVRAMTTDEMEHEGWVGPFGTVVELDDGTMLYPSRDEEGNGPGELFGMTKDGEDFIVFAGS